MLAYLRGGAQGNNGIFCFNSASECGGGGESERKIGGEIEVQSFAERERTILYFEDGESRGETRGAVEQSGKPLFLVFVLPQAAQRLIQFSRDTMTGSRRLLRACR